MEEINSALSYLGQLGSIREITLDMYMGGNPPYDQKINRIVNALMQFDNCQQVTLTGNWHEDFPIAFHDIHDNIK